MEIIAALPLVAVPGFSCIRRSTLLGAPVKARDARVWVVNGTGAVVYLPQRSRGTRPDRQLGLQV